MKKIYFMSSDLHKGVVIKENFWEKLGLCAEQDLMGHFQNRHLHMSSACL